MADEPTVTEEAVKDNEVTEEVDSYDELEDIEIPEPVDDDEEVDEEMDSAVEEEVTESEDEDVTEEQSDEPQGDAEQTEEVETEEPEPEKVEESDTDSSLTAREAFKERERKRLEEEAKLIEQKEKTQREYLNEAEDDKDLALRQLQIEAYNNRIDKNKTKLDTDINRAIADIDIFTKGTQEQQDELIRRVDDFERMYVTFDRNGEPTDVKGDLYQYLQTEAKAIERLSKVGEAKGRKDVISTRSRTTTPPAKAPPPKKTDEDLDDFDREIERIG